MPGPNPVLKARIDAATHTRFMALAQSQGLSDSELLRQAVHQLLGLPDAAPATRLVEPDDAQPSRVTVRLPRYLLTAARARAKSKGMALSRWLAALTQSHLATQPVLTEDELAAVEGATRELAAIGRNINQVARALNEAHFQTERVKLERLAELSECIHSTRSEIRALVRASRNTWSSDT